MASFVRPEKAARRQPRLSKWEKADIRAVRRTRLSKDELLREDIADKLRCPLCFCLPCVIIAFILLILIGIYVIRPYIQGRGLVSTQCRVNRTETSEQGSCSYRTDKFNPCMKIFCSYTFGNSDLFGRHSKCSWDSDLSAEDCAPTYFHLYGTPNKTISCFFDPDNAENVARILKVSGGEAAALIVIPLLFLLLWLVAFLFLIYDKRLRSNMEKQVMKEKAHDKSVSMRNGGSIPLGKRNGGFEIETTTTTSADSTTVTTVTTPGTRRRRKKKMPCARQHYPFNYLDEGILLEAKPLSSTTTDMSSNYSYVTVDTSPVCTCHHNGYLQAGFELLPYSRDYLRPVSSTPTGRSSLSNQKGRVFLPESFV
ncbi:uncharacterized protein [Montipora capricornis]|uniref:uncharacterized protein isoform X2 n=1 Tax=Montipora capricornis TaxID=246305 RepID=UPI0035F110FD